MIFLPKEGKDPAFEFVQFKGAKRLTYRQVQIISILTSFDVQTHC